MTPPRSVSSTLATITWPRLSTGRLDSEKTNEIKVDWIHFEELTDQLRPIKWEETREEEENNDLILKFI